MEPTSSEPFELKSMLQNRRTKKKIRAQQIPHITDSPRDTLILTETHKLDTNVQDTYDRQPQRHTNVHINTHIRHKGFTSQKAPETH